MSIWSAAFMTCTSVNKPVVCRNINCQNCVLDWPPKKGTKSSHNKITLHIVSVTFLNVICFLSNVGWEHIPGWRTFLSPPNDFVYPCVFPFLSIALKKKNHCWQNKSVSWCDNAAIKVWFTHETALVRFWGKILVCVKINTFCTERAMETVWFGYNDSTGVCHQGNINKHVVKVWEKLYLCFKPNRKQTTVLSDEVWCSVDSPLAHCVTWLPLLLLSLSPSDGFVTWTSTYILCFYIYWTSQVESQFLDGFNKLLQVCYKTTRTHCTGHKRDRNRPGLFDESRHRCSSQEL